MLFRYNLIVKHHNELVFNGNFSTLNKLVKVACCFLDDVCSIEASDELFNKSIPINMLLEEFVTTCTGI